MGEQRPSRNIDTGDGAHKAGRAVNVGPGGLVNRPYELAWA